MANKKVLTSTGLARAFALIAGKYAEKTDIPENVSELANDAGYITSNDVDLSNYIKGLSIDGSTITYTNGNDTTGTLTTQDTTYPNMTAAEATAGTDTSAKTISAKTLNDKIDEKVSAISDSTIEELWTGVDPSEDIVAYAPLNSPVFTGTPKAPTPPAADDSTKIATTAYVQNEISSMSKLTIADMFYMHESYAPIEVPNDVYPSIEPIVDNMFQHSTSISKGYSFKEPTVTISDYTWNDGVTNATVTLTFADQSTLSATYEFFYSVGGIGCTGVVNTGLLMNPEYRFEVTGKLIGTKPGVFVGAYESNNSRTTCRFLTSKLQIMWAANKEFAFPTMFERHNTSFTYTQEGILNSDQSSYNVTVCITQKATSSGSNIYESTYSSYTSPTNDTYLYLFGEQANSTTHNAVIINEVKIYGPINTESGERELLRHFIPELDSNERPILRDHVTNEIYMPVEGAEYLTESEALERYNV